MTRVRRRWQLSAVFRPPTVLVALLGTFLVLCGAYNAALPIFEAPDEGDHFHYADFLARERHLPDLVRDLPASHEIIQPPLYYAMVAAVIAPFDRGNLPAISRLNPDWFDPSVNVDHRSVVNQYLHSTTDDFPYQGAVLAVHVARLFSTLLGALTILLVCGTALELLPRISGGAGFVHGGAVALLAAALVAFNPKFVQVSSIVSNDVAITFAATLACWWMVRSWNRTVGKDRMQPATMTANNTVVPDFVLGGMIGIATLCKVSGLGLLVPAGLWIVLRIVRQRPTPRMAAMLAVHGVLALGAGLALTVGPWFAYNVMQYGSPLAWAQVQAANQSLLRPQPLDAAQMLRAIPDILVSYWGVIGVELRFPAWVDWVFFAGLILAVAGTLRAIICIRRSSDFRERAPNEVAPVIFLVVWEFALLASYALWLRDYAGTENSRLIFPGITLVAISVAAGWVALAPARFRGVVSVVSAGALLVCSALTPLLVIKPAFEAPVYLTQQALASLPGQKGITFGGKIRMQHAQINERSVQPGEGIGVSLFWGALAPINQSYHVILAAHDSQGKLIGRLEAIPFHGGFDTQRWQPGAIFRDDYRLPIDSAARRDVATVEVSVRGVYETPPLLPVDGANTDRFTIGRFKVLGIILKATAPRQPLQASFSNKGEPLIQLQGFDDQTVNGKRMVTLQWRCLKQPDQDYTLFVHVLDRNGTVIAQDDTQPLNGAYPTSMWDATEEILDRPDVELPASATQVRIGWYAGGSRLTARKPDGSPWPDNAVVIDLPRVNGP